MTLFCRIRVVRVFRGEIWRFWRLDPALDVEFEERGRHDEMRMGLDSRGGGRARRRRAGSDARAVSVPKASGQIIVADSVDGKPLFDYQGPLRIVAPGDKRGARSIRMLERIEIVRVTK